MHRGSYRNKDGKEALKYIDFQVKAGEIVGIVGVEGNGQTELVDALFGYKKITSGAILLNGTDISKMNIKSRRNLGLSYIPEDRMVQGSAADGNIRENIISSFYCEPSVSGRVFMKNQAVSEVTDELIGRFDILCNGADSKISSLSGGNIQ